MHLVVLVPLVALLHRIVVPRLPWHVLDRALCNRLHRCLSLIKDIGKLDFVLAKPLLLDFVEQVDGGIIKPLGIHNIEPDPSIQSRLLDFLRQSLLDFCFIPRRLCSLSKFGLLLSDQIGLIHAALLVNALDLELEGLFSRFVFQCVPILKLLGICRVCLKLR